MSSLPEIGSLVLFLDSKQRNPSDETGFNQIGVVISDSEILCKRGNRIVTVSEVDSENNKYDVYAPIAEELTANVIEYFTNNIISQEIFDLGVAALANKSSINLFRNPILMPNFEKLPCNDFENKWRTIETVIRPGDMVFTFNKGFVSKIIARLDNGSWSHVGIYVGGGLVCEAITSGVTKSPLKKYKENDVRIGIYRHDGMSPDTAKNIAARCEEELGKSYNWWGAVRLGVKMIFKIKSEIPSPNGLIFGGQLYLVEYA